MAAEFEEGSIINPKEIQAPLVMKKNFEDLLATVKLVKAEAEAAAKVLDTSSSTKKVTDATTKLTAQSNALVSVQKKLADLVAKDTAEYRDQQLAINKLNAEMKTKQVLGDKEATQVNKLNSSLLQIEAALNANRKAYAELRTEQDRNSIAGKDLLKVIQDQAAAQNELRTDLKQYSQNVGDYVGAIVKANEQIQKQEAETKNLIAIQNQLDTSTKQGKKAFSDLDTQIKANVKEINTYQQKTGQTKTSVKDLTKETKAETSAFKGLGGAAGSLSPELSTATGAAKGFGEALLSLAANPVGLVILAIVAALAGLSRYFTASSEGQDKWNKVLAVGSTLLDQFLDVLEKVGKALVSAVEAPKAAWQAFTKFMEPIIKVFKDLGSGLADIFTFDFKAGAAKIQQAFEELKKVGTDAWDSITKAATDYYDESQRRAAISLKIAEEENKLRKDQIADIIDDSFTELAVAKDIQIVHDKLRNTDEKRLAALKDANALLEAQAKGDIELAAEELKTLEDKVALDKLGLDTTNLEGKERRKIIDTAISQGKVDYDNRQKIAELIAKVNSTETAFLDGQKKRLAEEFSLVSEIAAKRQAQIKAEQTALANLNKWRLESDIALNKRIVEDEFSTIGESTKALIKAQEDRIQLTNDAADKEKQAALDAAKDRVQLSDAELKEIYGNKKLSLDEQLKLDDEFRTKDAQHDQAYLDDITKITDKAGEDVIGIIDDTNKAAEDNVFKILARDAKKLDEVLSTNTNKALTLLEQKFAAGVVSYKEYQDQKEKIQESGNLVMMQKQLQALKEEAANLQNGSQQQIEIIQQASDVELKIEEAKNQQKIQYEQDLNQAVNDLKTQGSQAAIQIVENAFAQEDMDRQARLAHIDVVEKQELALAGNNEAAKAAITNKYAAEKNKIALQQAAADRKRATFEKTAAAISIAINTAKGIGYALGTYPPPASFILAGVTAVLGAIQLAAVLSKPIPSYAVGTEDHPGGLARVGERGPELVVTPSGHNFLTPNKETYMDLPKHSKVYTHEDTKQMALAAIYSGGSQGTAADVRNDEQIGNKLDELIKITKNKRERDIILSKNTSREWFMNNTYK